MIKVKTEGRTDLNDYFRLSGIRENKRLPHHPFLVFLIDEKNQEVKIKIVGNIIELLTYEDETKVMSQWGGQWSSDFFHFKVKDLKDYIAKNPKEKYYVA